MEQAAADNVFGEHGEPMSIESIVLIFQMFTL